MESLTYEILSVSDDEKIENFKNRNFEIENVLQNISIHSATSENHELSVDSHKSESEKNETSVISCGKSADIVDPPMAYSAILVKPSAQTNIGKYQLVRTIGKGNFAKVKLAIHMATGVEVAIKIINKKGLDWAAHDRLRREVNILQMLNHPNIVGLLEIIENDEVICLVQEYANGGEIFDYLVAHGKMRENEARNKFRQLISAIHYCHSKNIVHRDLKAENILLDSKLNVKVADFGLGNVFKNDQKLTTFCGSPPYAAPELFLGIRYYGPGVDIWSLGVILFTLVVGHLPFDATDLRELRTKILTVQYRLGRGEVSGDLECLLKKMLVLDPRDRYALQVLMNDRWVNTGFDGSPLAPYQEPPVAELNDDYVDKMLQLGFTEVDLINSVVNKGFDHVYATYTLLPEMMQKDKISFPRSIDSTTTSSPGSSAVGRFIVEPSSEHTHRARNHSSNRENKNNPNNLNSQYSATNSLPAALKRAFANMGRSFVGTSTVSPGTFTPLPSNDFEQRTAKQQKPASKETTPRMAITPAPVPLNARQKRPAALQVDSDFPSSKPHKLGKKKQHNHKTQPIDSTRQRTPSIKDFDIQPTIEQEDAPVHAENINFIIPTVLPVVILSDADNENLERISEISREEDSITHAENPARSSFISTESERSTKNAPSEHDEIIWNKTENTNDFEHTNEDKPYVDLNEQTESIEVVVQGRNFSSKVNMTDVIASSPFSVPANEETPVDGNYRLSTNPDHQSTWKKNIFKAIGAFFQGPSKQASIPTQLIHQNKQVQDRPRIVRSHWGIYYTSKKMPYDLIEDIKLALAAVKGCHWKEDNHWKYLLHCGWAELISGEDDTISLLPSTSKPLSVNDLIQWDMEVCEMSRLRQRGVCLKRMRGSAIQFQKIVSQVVAALNS